MQIRKPSENDFITITRLTDLFKLDNRRLSRQQFLVAADRNEILGFGRITEYKAYSELCSLAVIESQRNKSIGTQLVHELIKKASGPLYLVCIIPEFFKALGFTVVHQYPPELKDKLGYCQSSLSVDKPYVVMEFVADNKKPGGGIF